VTPAEQLRDMVTAIAELPPEPLAQQAGTMVADYVRRCLPDHVSDVDAGYVLAACSQVVNELAGQMVPGRLLSVLAMAAVNLTAPEREATP